MPEIQKVETIESLCDRLKRLADVGLGDCQIRCFDGFLYDDGMMVDTQNRICKISGYACDTDLGRKTVKFKNKLKDAFDEYYNSINDDIEENYQYTIEFPVKLGDHVWLITYDENSELTYREYIVNGFNVMYDGTTFATVGNDGIHPVEALNLSQWGETLFKTPEEAAIKLKELETDDE